MFAGALFFTLNMSEFINPYKLFLGSFIPNWLLQRKEISSNAKLVYARFMQYAGENGCVFPSLDSISKECGISTRTIWSAVKELESFNLVVCKRRGQGKSNVYYFLRHAWMVFKVDDSQYLHGCSANSAIPDSQTSASQDLHTSANEYNHIIKSKNKIKEESLTLPFSSEEFKKAWEEWEMHRKELNKKLTNLSKKRQFKELKGWGERAAIESINNSIKNGYQGLFAPKSAINDFKSNSAVNPYPNNKNGVAPHLRPEFGMFLSNVSSGKIKMTEERCIFVNLEDILIGGTTHSELEAYLQQHCPQLIPFLNDPRLQS